MYSEDLFPRVAKCSVLIVNTHYFDQSDRGGQIIIQSDLPAEV